MRQSEREGMKSQRCQQHKIINNESVPDHRKKQHRIEYNEKKEMNPHAGIRSHWQESRPPAIGLASPDALLRISYSPLRFRSCEAKARATSARPHSASRNRTTTSLHPTHVGEFPRR